MSTRLRIEPEARFTIGRPPKFLCVLVGAGGTGSYLMEALAQLAYHTREHGGPEIAIVLIDGDHVEPHNVGRQKFAVAEIGRNKAQTLAGRVNAALGLKTVAVPQMATSDLLLQIAAQYAHQCRVLCGAVDTTGARRSMHEALHTAQRRRLPGYTLWLDCGNHEQGGQVCIGNCTEPEQLMGAFKLPGICTALPAPGLQMPALIRFAPPPMLDCAEAVMQNLQSLQVNRWLAAIASQYLTTLVEQGQLTTFQTTVDLRAGAMHSLRITLDNVRRAGGPGMTAAVLQGRRRYRQPPAARIYEHAGSKPRLRIATHPQNHAVPD